MPSAPAALDPPRTRPPAPPPVRGVEGREVDEEVLPPPTAADIPGLLDRLGGVDPARVWLSPAPGTATADDAERSHDRGYAVELIDGTLVEKAMSDWTGYLGLEIGALLRNFVKAGRLGVVHGADGYFRFGGDLRAPDASFTPKSRRNGPLLRRGYSGVPPALVVEVFSPRNTAREMARKRETYFATDVRTVWELDEDAAGPLVRVFEGPGGPRATLRSGDTLTGGAVLPGFAVAVDDLFADPVADDADDVPAEN